MKRIKNFALFCTAIALFSAPAFSFDWGGKIYSDTSFIGKNNEALKLKETDNANLWLSVPLSKDNSKYFSAEALYQFKYDDSLPSDKMVNTIDLNLFKFVARQKLSGGKRFAVSAGRFGVSDLTGKVFAQNSDGVLLQFSTLRFNTSLYGGYTGLLNANTTTILNNPEGTSWTIGDNAVYRLAPKYIPFGLNLSFPSLFANQTLSLQGWGFIDANDNDYNRWYGILGLNGFLASSLSYSAKTVFQSVNFESLSNLSELSFFWYLTDTLSMNLGGVYASGKSGNISAFRGFSSCTALLSAKEPEYSSLVKAELGITKTFGQAVYLNGGTAVAFSLEEENEGYKGIQFQAGGMYKVFNDVQLGANFSQFVGKETQDNRTSISVKAILVF